MSKRAKRKVLRVSSTTTPKSERTALPTISKSEPPRNNFSNAMDPIMEKKCFSKQDACRYLLLALCTTNSTAHTGPGTASFVRLNTQKLSFTGSQIYEKLTAEIKDIDESFHYEYCMNAVKELVAGEFIVVGNLNKCTLTEDSVYHIKAEHLVKGIEDKYSGISMDLALKQISGVGKYTTSSQIIETARSDEEGCSPLSSSPNETSPQKLQKQLSLGSEVNIPITTGGTINQLIEYLTTENSSDISFRDTFVLTHPTFIDPIELVQLLCNRWDISPTEEESSSPTQLKLFRDTKQKPIRIKIMGFVKIWADHFPELFQQQEFLEALESLKSRVMGGMEEKLHQQFSSTITNSCTNHLRAKHDALDNILNLPHPQNLDSVLFILDNHPEIIAQNITIIDHLIFSNISASELLNKNWMNKNTKLEKAPNICRLIERFNKMAHWVASTVSQCVSIDQRVSVLSRMIAIAHSVKEHNNHFAGMALLAGLNSTPVKRLTRTWDRIEHEDFLLLESLKELYKTTDNYGHYRAHLKKTTTSCTPYIGLYLRDLVYIEDGNASYLGELINFRKRTMYSRVLLEIKRFQSRAYPFELNEDILPVVRDIEQISETESYENSQRIEPRNPHVTIEELLMEEKDLLTQKKELNEKLAAARAKLAEVKRLNLQLKQTKRTESWRSFRPASSPAIPRRCLLRNVNS